jgi:hypothetical protein
MPGMLYAMRYWKYFDKRLIFFLNIVNIYVNMPV